MYLRLILIAQVLWITSFQLTALCLFNLWMVDVKF